MGEIRFVGTGETRGYLYPVSKKRFVGTGETCGYPYLVCKKEFSSTSKIEQTEFLLSEYTPLKKATCIRAASRKSGKLLLVFFGKRRRGVH